MQNAKQESVIKIIC